MNKRTGKYFITSIGLSLILVGTSTPGASATAHSETAKSISPVYAFKGATLTGTNFSGEELAGKPAVLWFWAPWCVKCLVAAPDVRALAKSFKGKVKVIGIPGLAPVNDMKQFVKKTRTSNFVHVPDTDGTIWLHFEIPVQSSFIFMTSKGTISRQLGDLSKADLFKRTRQLIKKS